MKSKKIPTIPQNDSFEEDELPDGWKRVCLSQISELIMGQSPPGSTYNTKGDGVPFFQGKADFTEISPVVRTWCTQPKKNAKSGDILISVRAPVGPTNVADRDCSIGRGLAAIRPKNEIPTKFILYYLKFKEPELALSGKGSTFTAIKKEDLANLSIPLPPLAEQQRIVARVEALLTQVNAARDRLSRVPLIMKRFRQAVLAAACSGRLTEEWREENALQNATSLLELISTERQAIIRGKQKRTDKDTEWMQKDEREIPEQWLMVKINDILHYQRSAGYGVLQPGSETPDGIPMVRVCDILDGKILVNQLKRISPDIESQYKRTRLDGGEVLVTIVGTIGRTAVVPKNAKGSNIARAVAVLPLCPHVDPEYISYCLTDSKKNIELVDLAREVARKTLNLGLLKAVEIPLPPLAEQHEIVRRVGLLFERADAIDQEVVAAGRRCSRLTQAVLGKAFAGKL
jgi:type I restriction enzyme S subunit